MKKKILIYILIGVLVYVAVLAIVLCCLYAALGDGIWDYLKEWWSWYKDFLF